jgi:hypothetical protein
MQHRFKMHGFWLCLLLLTLPALAHAQSCPNPPVVNISSPQVPTDVCIPQGFPGNPIMFFDDYSWRAFVAMVWPAQQGQRGTPDTTKKVGDTSGPLVFETLKEDWELFQPNGTAPAPNWNDFGAASPCPNVTVGFNDLVLASFSKFGNLGQAGFGNLVHSLPAQNGTWVRYATAFDQIEFTQIMNGKWYLRSNLPCGGLTFQNGGLDVKSSWIDMTNVPHPERYYTRKAWLMDPVSGACSTQPVTVGLVGLHIVQKTPSRPQWIWTTFEQVDNVPPAAQGSPAPPFTFNSGSGTPMPSSDPNGGFPPNSWTNPVIYNVDRQKPVNPSTQKVTNAGYQKALAGTIWQNYILVMTQWPIVANSPSTPGTPANTFPGTGATSAFANTTLETWDQKSITTGCMNCHNVTKQNTDFLWSLQINAFPSTLGANPMAAPAAARSERAIRLSPALQRLKTLLQSAESTGAKPAKPSTKKGAKPKPPQ